MRSFLAGLCSAALLGNPGNSMQVLIRDTAGKLLHSSMLHGDNLSPP